MFLLGIQENHASDFMGLNSTRISLEAILLFSIDSFAWMENPHTTEGEKIKMKNEPRLFIFIFVIGTANDLSYRALMRLSFHLFDDKPEFTADGIRFRKLL